MNLASIRKEFQGFPKQYSLAPLWYWNDDLREDELVRQLEEMRHQDVNEAMIFPMAGMNAKYLSEEYFNAYRFTLQEAQKRGMRIWIYDEYCWPSGLAGGLINEKYPEYLMTACRFYTYPVAPGDARAVVIRLPAGNLIWAQADRAGGNGRPVVLTEACDESSLRWHAGPGAWEITVCVIHPIQHILDTTTASRWASNLPGYLDVMNREAVAKYIELVYEGHYRAAPQYFGRTMPGFFTDEPGVWYDFEVKGGREELKINPVADNRRQEGFADNPMLHGFTRSVPWTRDLLALFRERWGYDLRPHLTELAKGKAADRKVCYEYFLLISDRFADCYAGQIGAWCGRHQVAFSGHWGEGAFAGDYYRQVKPQQTPGIDLLGGLGAVENSITLPRTVATIARMQGRPRVLAETYGVTPWNFELAHKIQVADLLTVLGINLHAPIDYAYSFRSFRKHTSNPPGFYQASNWQYQRFFSDHTARFCQALSAGRSAVCVGLLYASSAAVSNTISDPQANAQLEHDLKRTFLDLINAQIETDVVPETGLPEGRWQNGRLIYPGATYDTLGLPYLTILQEDLVRRLVRFVQGGGTLLIFGRIPDLDPRGRSLAAAWRVLTGGKAVAETTEIITRQCGRGRWMFIPDFTRRVTLLAPIGSGEKTNLFDGTDSLFCLSPQYPSGVAVDFGQPLELTTFAMTMEGIKQAIVYDYELQISADGQRWKMVAAFKRNGLIHKADLGGVKARHFRLYVRSASNPQRFFGLTDLSIHYRDEQGEEQRWVPPHSDFSALASSLAELLPPLTFRENGQLAGKLAGASRLVGDDRIFAIVSRSSRERQLEGRVANGCEVESWDLDTGRIERVVLAGATFPLTLAPYAAKLFVLRKQVPAALPVGSLDRRRVTVAESAGPWPFRPARANAFPLAATGNLQMADPTRPEKWWPSESGRIPEVLRPVCVLLFSCEVDVAWRSGAEELLVEEGVFNNLAVNGHPIPLRGFRRNRYYDAFGLSVPIGRLLKKGRNRITGWYLPEMYERMTKGSCYHWPIVQPTLDAFLLGDFAVSSGRLIKPARQIDGRSWQVQGYPYFSGTGVYTVAFQLREKRTPLWLEVAARDGVVEVRCRGRTVGTRIAPPYLVEVTREVQPGLNTFEIRVTNTIGPLFAPMAIGSLTRQVPYASGLESARLVTPLG